MHDVTSVLCCCYKFHECNLDIQMKCDHVCVNFLIGSESIDTIRRINMHLCNWSPHAHLRYPQQAGGEDRAAFLQCNRYTLAL